MRQDYKYINKNRTAPLLQTKRLHTTFPFTKLHPKLIIRSNRPITVQQGAAVHALLDTNFEISEVSQ